MSAGPPAVEKDLLNLHCVEEAMTLRNSIVESDNLEHKWKMMKISVRHSICLFTMFVYIIPPVGNIYDTPCNLA